MRRLTGSLVNLTDRAILRVAGDSSARFLQGLCSQDMLALQSADSPAALPAAFLSPKGKVLCETIVTRREKSEFLLDCHKDVAKSLMRLLIRHRLREPLAIEDVSASHQAVAYLPPAAAASADTRTGDAECPGDLLPSFFPDPRFAAMGHRAILESSCKDAHSQDIPTSDLEDYHLWRLRCAVPEGPADLPVDQILPLHANLDLLNFVSFNKGCYVGQELTARTKHRGAVRRRFFSVLAVDATDSAKVTAAEADLQGLAVGSPLVSTAPLDAALGEEEVFAVMAQQPGKDESKQVGVLHSVMQNLGLCLLRCEGAFNEAEAFAQAPLPEGTQLTSASGRLRLLLRAPPYAFK
eukprot:TRINITY_DN113530_c0_g1_i1.p1 TRINITY_DN113530_c0_g1~~TRINITY_DN113530_c0_g1_i1.p1  ORF type:complete len:352 (-),score=78.97 TRINITY_DN113530_c0_g1_i1:12-1067(-)